MAHVHLRPLPVPPHTTRSSARRLALLGLLAVSLAACESPLSSSELLALAEAESRWAGRGFDDYAVEMRQACFCPAIVAQWARVEVVGGSVNRVVSLGSGTEVSPAERLYFPTVEHVFRYIREANGDEWLTDVAVRFDPELGFPTYVSFVTKPDVADGGGAFYLQNAGALP